LVNKIPKFQRIFIYNSKFQGRRRFFSKKNGKTEKTGNRKNAGNGKTGKKSGKTGNFSKKFIH
jgi:hypothetical protein